VPFVARPAFTFWPPDELPPDGSHQRSGPARAERERLGLHERYLVYSGRYDARQDLATLLRALASLTAAGRPEGLPTADPWPPRVLLVGTSPEDRASLARAAAKVDVGDALAYAPTLPDDRLATLVRGARAAILPALSDATGLPALEAIACGTPVVASAVGALPEVVGAAGILVPPREPDRLAAALATIWTDDRVHERLAAVARDRAEAERRTWADVAIETRRVYAEVGIRRSAAD
jgi:glycosyltransferase involved in cell wall biosynthesis